ncbi:hypothetical protein PAL_GLEAN10012889 [Pteropus alecto]|uniref:Uncharacterized protein n=1 Tax=Pteropus alecto TaxID=9402 RepID=L5KQV6_PTEAL|nr:hypothetical protein PAL_GLEAN10012889 [Pteropus alecto]
MGAGRGGKRRKEGRSWDSELEGTEPPEWAGDRSVRIRTGRGLRREKQARTEVRKKTLQKKKARLLQEKFPHLSEA